ncbi:MULTISPECIES: hypothetical protein [Frankia]|uniref:hypothetical protein n=1 Tax=Frankia TaxID=1854 RepID=UPI0002D7044C|nr:MULTISPECIES: hypothetical protein [Frankia]
MRTFLTERFTDPYLTRSETGYQELLATVSAHQVHAARRRYDTGGERRDHA